MRVTRNIFTQVAAIFFFFLISFSEILFFLSQFPLLFLYSCFVLLLLLLLFLCLILCFLKLKIYILINIQLCGRLSDKKQDYFFGTNTSSFITSPEFNRLTKISFDARMKKVEKSHASKTEVKNATDLGD